MNAIKDYIKSGRTVIGTTAGPNVDVSILADAGYDFLLFDPQHSAWEIKQLQPSIQNDARQAGGAGALAANQAYRICFALDAGAPCRWSYQRGGGGRRARLQAQQFGADP